MAAEPAAVHAYLSDGRNLPDWAPNFAERVRPGGAGWIVSRGEAEFEIAVHSEPRSGTVDFVDPRDHARGLFARVLPNGSGSQVVFVIMFAPDTPEDVVATQMLTLESELASIRAVCE